MGVAIAATFVALQPLTAPWWVYADSDAVYVSSGLNIVYGAGTTYFAHPGLPLQELAAFTFELRRWFEGGVDRHAYVDKLLLDLNTSRPYYRIYGILLFLAAVVAVFLLVERLLGRWYLSLAASLMLLGAPGLIPMSIQFRADSALPLVLVVWTLLITLALQRRDEVSFAVAGVLTGFALTVKLSAAPLLLGLALALALRAPLNRYPPRSRVRRRNTAIAASGAVVAAGIVLNTIRVPFTPTRSQLAALVALIGGVLLWWVAARVVCRGPLSPPWAQTAAAVAIGILIPAAIDVPDGLRMLPWIARGLTGSGIAAGVTPFASSQLGILEHFPLVYALPLLALPLVALAHSIRRREALLATLSITALTATGAAMARLVGREWYFIPAYVLSIPPTLLWLGQLRRRSAAAAAAVLLSALAIVPQTLHARDPEHKAAGEERIAHAAAALAQQRLGPKQVGLAPSQYPVPDVQFFELVQVYVEHVPDWTYRYLPATPPAADTAAARGLRPRLAIGEQGSRLPFGARTYTMRPEAFPGLPFGVARLSP